MEGAGTVGGARRDVDGPIDAKEVRPILGLRFGVPNARGVWPSVATDFVDESGVPEDPPGHERSSTAVLAGSAGGQDKDDGINPVRLSKHIFWFTMRLCDDLVGRTSAGHFRLRKPLSNSVFMPQQSWGNGGVNGGAIFTEEPTWGTSGLAVPTLQPGV